MQTITYKHGYKIIDNFPDYTPEEQVIVNERFLQKLYDILFTHDKITVKYYEDGHN